MRTSTLFLPLVLATSCGGDRPAPVVVPPKPAVVAVVAPEAGAPPVRLEKRGPTIAAGVDRTWVVLASGRVVSWGAFARDLHTGPTKIEPRPRVLPDAANVVGVAVAVQAPDQLGFRGVDACYFAPGHPCTIEPLVVPPGEGELRAESPGADSSCVIRKDRILHCTGWIASEYAIFEKKTYTPQPARDFGKMEGVRELAVGARHACVLKETGEVWCWGHLGAGLLGDGRTWDRPRAELPGIVDATRIALEDVGGCVLRKSGRVACWGSNLYGRLGMSGMDGRATAGDIPGVESATKLVADGRCVIRDGGKVQCWGLRKTQPDPFFVDVSDALDAAFSDANDDRRVCVARRAGITECHDIEGKKPKSTVARAAGAKAISVGAGDSQYVTCALLPNARVRCWADEHYGSVTFAVPKDAVEVRAAGLSRYDDPHPSFVQVRTASGKLLSAIFQLPEQKPNPNEGLGLMEVSWNEASGVAREERDHTLRSDGKVHGRDGDEVEGIDDAVDLADAGRGKSACVVHKTGKVSCWGREVGATFGRGEAAYSDKPVRVVLPEQPLL